jgi:beta-N-acetylhexosaminidase
VQKDKYTRVKLICFGEDKTPDGSLKAMVTEALEKEGLNVEEYIPTFKDDLKAVRELDSHTLTVYICNMEAKSNNTAVRIYWFPKHAMQIPRYIEAEDGIFLSFSNPYHLQDIPRIRTYINAYSASQATVDAVIGKMFGRSEFKGISPVDAFCGLMDTHL